MFKILKGEKCKKRSMEKHGDEYMPLVLITLTKNLIIDQNLV